MIFTLALFISTSPTVQQDLYGFCLAIRLLEFEDNFGPTLAAA